jgi:lipopolysaccharide transport system ATP-binding protein
MTSKNDIAVEVRGLGKLYQLAHAAAGQRTLTETLRDAVTAPVRRFRELRGTSTTLEEFWALKDVSFDIPRGEVMGILGRNGAGKSTLLKILSRIVEPTEGEAVLRGRVSSLLEVGTGFHPELSGRENIFLNGAILGMRRAEILAKFDEIVAFAEVEKFLDTPVKRYSSGMYVRLAFAVAAHLDPDILIVDEVLAVGDAQFQQKCIGKMQSISASGSRTVVFVSHNVGALRSLCTSCLFLSAGRVRAQGTVDHIVKEYLKPEARSASEGNLVSKHGIELFEAALHTLPDRSPAHTVPFLSPCEIRVRLGSRTGFDQGALVVHVLDSLGNRVSSLNTTEEGVAARRLGPDQTFVYPIPAMTLMPGRYAVNVYVHKPHDPTRYFEAESLFEFEVVPSPVPGGLLPYQSHHGITRFVAGCRVE